MISKNNLGFAVVIALLVVTSIFSLNLFLKQRAQRDILDMGVFPRGVGNWTGNDLPITEKEYGILETRNIVLREYANPRGDKIILFIIY